MGESRGEMVHWLVKMEAEREVGEGEREVVNARIAARGDWEIFIFLRIM